MATSEKPVGNLPSTPARRLELTIHGRVQGVGYRYATLEQARRLGLVGWVRNTHDGKVELVAEGPTDPLQRLLTWCKAGPPGARVSQLSETWGAASGEFSDFGIRR